MKNAEISDPRKRDDFSKFLIHLTRNYKGTKASENLVNMINSRQIEARNAHCLFSRKFSRMQFSDMLQRKFNTVCFTETPLHQIKNITTYIPKRRIQLQPYGLVFWRDNLVHSGANPAIYINANGTYLRNLLLSQFTKQFSDINKFNKLRIKEKEFYNEIIQYYSLINIISDKHDFSWEREWRFQGNFEFDYNQIVAIIAKNPPQFLKRYEKEFTEEAWEHIKVTPIINPYWSYDEIIEAFSVVIWELKYDNQ